VAGEERFLHRGGIIEVNTPVVFPAAVDIQRSLQLELLVENKSSAQNKLALSQAHNLMTWGGKKPYAGALLATMPATRTPAMLAQASDGSPKFTVTGSDTERGASQFEIWDTDYERRYIFYFVTDTIIENAEGNEVTDLLLSADPEAENYEVTLYFYGGLVDGDVNWSGTGPFFDFTEYFEMDPGSNGGGFFIVYTGQGIAVTFRGLAARATPIVVTVTGKHGTTKNVNVTVVG
jgi:hypothetical protein